MIMDLAAFLRARLDEDWTSATPGRAELDDLRFELKRGDSYEQHLSSRIEDGLDGQSAATADQYPGGPSEYMRGYMTSLEIALRALAAVYSAPPGLRPGVGVALRP